MLVYVGRLGYAYKDKYHLTATMRRDRCLCLFGEDQKMGRELSIVRGCLETASAKEDFKLADRKIELPGKISFPMVKKNG